MLNELDLVELSNLASTLVGVKKTKSDPINKRVSTVLTSETTAVTPCNLTQGCNMFIMIESLYLVNSR